MPGDLNDREFNKFAADDSVRVTDPQQVLKKYSLTDYVESVDPEYYGFLALDGSWYIQKFTASGTIRYTKGDSDYTTNWTNRVSLTYDYFDAVFG